MTGITALPSVVHWTKLFQEMPLLNRAVLDTVGYAVPSILLTRNPIERKEQTLDRVLTIGSAFFLAPLHAWLFLKLFSRKFIPLGVTKGAQELMRLPYKALLNKEAFQKGLKELAHELQQDSRGASKWVIPEQLQKDKQFAEKIRKEVIQQKSHMLLWDMLTEALIFSNIRFVTNWFTRKNTGKNQFSGEYGAAEQAKLDKLHQENKKKERFSERFKQIFSNTLAIIIPPILAIGLGKAVANEANTALWARGLRKIASGFDYNKGIFLGMGAMGVITAMQFFGYAMAARDKYELKEKATVQTIGNYIFFFGNWTWMQLLGRTLANKKDFPALRSIKQAIDHTSLPLAKRITAANYATLFYWACFLLNNLSFAALVVATNKSTVKQVKADVAKFDQDQAPTRKSLLKPQDFWIPPQTMTQWQHPPYYGYSQPAYRSYAQQQG